MWVQVPGANNRATVVLYALSTCPWCKRTKKLLNDNSVAYRYVDVDLLSGDDEDRIVAEISRLNPMRSFPTLLIDGEVVAGFQEGKIRELLGL